MAYKRLYIWVEGDDDERFFEKVIGPLFAKSYNHVHFVQYRQMQTKKVNAFLKTIKRLRSAGDAAYIFTSDINRQPCVTTKKKRLLKLYAGLDRDCVAIVIREIESWFLAGLTKKACSQLGIQAFSHTDDVTKEQFNKLRRDKYDSRVDFQQEILKLFDLGTARRKNTSFDYFVRKYRL